MEQVENKMKQSFDRMLELEVRFTVAALKGDIFSKIILFHIRFITVCLCTSVGVFCFFFVDLHCLASSHSGNI